MNLGVLYAKQENYSTALEYFFKTNDIYQNCLPINHPNFGLVYIHIGTIYHKQGDYDSALSYLHQGLDVQQKTLPAQHPLMIYTYTNLGVVYLNKSNDVAAYNFLQKALEMIDPSSSHPYLSIIMQNLGILHKKKNNLSEALNFHHKALNAEIKSTSPNHKNLLKIYKSLGEIYIRQGEWLKVIDYYQKAVPIFLEYNDSDVVGFYNVIACSYALIGNYETASRYVKLALDAGRRMLPADHFQIREAEEHQRNLSLVLHRTDKNSEQRRSGNQTK
jgi:tetratricopeptide (TPR) repeat protein